MQRRVNILGRKALRAAWIALVGLLALTTATQTVLPLQLVERHCLSDLEFEEGSEPAEQSGEEEAPLLLAAVSLRIRHSDPQPSARWLLPLTRTASTRANSSRTGPWNGELDGRNGFGGPLRC